MKIYHLVALGAGLAAGALFYSSAVQRGVQKERASVEATGKKTHEKAAKARAAAAARPAPSVLDGQWRD